MKYLYILSFLFTYTICAAQDTQLLEREWFLNELIINGESFLRTPNVDGSASFYEDYTSTNHPMCKGGTYALITYDGTDVFEIFQAAILLDFGCNPDATAFMHRHYNFYGVFEMPYNNPFDYMIETNVDEFSLTVTNANGDQAIYGTQPILSAEGFDESSVAVHPNPAKNELFLSLKNNTGKLNVKILNIEGKLLSTNNFKLEKESSLDVSNLKSGIYFLNIEDKNGRMEVKKFVKN